MRITSPFPAGSRRRRWLPYTLGCLFLLALASPADAQDGWTRFRGPDGTGISDCRTIPVAPEPANYRWQIKLPGSGHSSPVLWEDKIFLTCQIEGKQQRMIVCIGADDGRLAWTWKDTYEEYPNHHFNSYAASTPAVDARGVYVCWVSGETFLVAALDHDGRLRWRRRMGDFRAQFGAGASPIVLGGTVIAGNDHAGQSSFLIGLDAETGRTRWKIERASGFASYVTPAVYRPKDGPVQLIFAGPANGITSVDPQSGKVIWEVGGLFTLKTVACPVVADGLIFAFAGKGGGGQESAVVRPADAKSGRRAETAYTIESGLPYVPTPVAVGEYLYLLSDGGVATCLKAATGKVVWQERVGGPYFSSPICVGGRIYAVSREGEITVFQASPEFKLLAKSRLPEGTYATPAVAGGRIYFRTFNHLICVEAAEKKTLPAGQ